MAREKQALPEPLRATMNDVREGARGQGASLYALARRVLLAGLGSIALTLEEAQAFVDKLVERGEIAESEAQKLIQEFRTRARRQKAQIQETAGTRVDAAQGRAASSARQAGQALEERVGAALRRMNVPTQRDIDELSAKIRQLSAKIDELKARRR